MKFLKKTMSLCPGCVERKQFDKMMIEADIFEEDGKVWITKTCPVHGETRELYYSDYELYKKAESFADKKGTKLNDTFNSCAEKDVVCPLDCGLCNKHKTHTALANVVLTNRCDLSCWYCFFYQKKGEAVYEPSKEELRKMLQNLRNEKPVACNAVQLTGGEPSMREDAIEIIKMCKELGFDHVQFNTNAINISKNLQLVKDIHDAGCGLCYVSFDGVTPKTNPKNYWEFPQALENFRAGKVAVVLVPTVIRGVNDHELGDIIRFAAGNIDVVRGIDFQPVSLVGMMPREHRESQRITIPDVVKKVEEQTDGQIGREDFYTIPVASKITNFVEALTKKPAYRLSTHFACGVGTYVFKDGNKLVPLPRFVDVEGLFEKLDELTDDLNKSKMGVIGEKIVEAKLLASLNGFVDYGKKPKDINFTGMIIDALLRGSYQSLGKFHEKSLFIGMMHFMDAYNYDVERVERCAIHYSLPDGRIVPFCAFNVIPDLYRDKNQKEFSVTPSDWEKATGKCLADDKFMRKIPEGAEAEKVHGCYRKFIR